MTGTNEDTKQKSSGTKEDIKLKSDGMLIWFIGVFIGMPILMLALDVARDTYPEIPDDIRILLAVLFAGSLAVVPAHWLTRRIEAFEQQVERSKRIEEKLDYLVLQTKAEQRAARHSRKGGG